MFEIELRFKAIEPSVMITVPRLPRPGEEISVRYGGRLIDVRAVGEVAGVRGDGAPMTFNGYFQEL